VSGVRKPPVAVSPESDRGGNMYVGVGTLLAIVLIIIILVLIF
jgi:hypothetical protein